MLVVLFVVAANKSKICVLCNIYATFASFLLVCASLFSHLFGTVCRCVLQVFTIFSQKNAILLKLFGNCDII